MSLEGEQRPVDAAAEVAERTAETAVLAEYIRDTEPRHAREELFNQLIKMIDDTHELAFDTYDELDRGDE